MEDEDRGANLDKQKTCCLNDFFFFWLYQVSSVSFNGRHVVTLNCFGLFVNLYIYFRAMAKILPAASHGIHFKCFL